MGSPVSFSDITSNDVLRVGAELNKKNGAVQKTSNGYIVTISLGEGHTKQVALNVNDALKSLCSIGLSKEKAQNRLAQRSIEKWSNSIPIASQKTEAAGKMVQPQEREVFRDRELWELGYMESSGLGDRWDFGDEYPSFLNKIDTMLGSSKQSLELSDVAITPNKNPLARYTQAVTISFRDKSNQEVTQILQFPLRTVPGLKVQAQFIEELKSDIEEILKPKK